MIIGVDCGCLGIKDKRLRVGVYEIAKNLLQNLAKLDRKNKYLLYSFYPIEKKLLKTFGSQMENVVVGPVRGWIKIWLPLRLKKDKPDVFLALSQTVPSAIPFGHKPYVIDFFYDLAFEKFPHMYPGSLSKLRRNTKKAACKSDVIVCVSKNSKKDLEKIYKINSRKIKVFYPGLSKIFTSYGSPYKANKPYFLFVGALKRVKNVPGLIKAFYYFLENSQKDYDLYLVGGDKWLDGDIEDLIRKNKNENIKIMGFVDDKKLARLYRGAVAFVSPSFYEGFGLTFLEAMKSGCPVIGSNSGSVPEIVSSAGILINPTDHKKIGKAMLDVSQSLEKRQSLSRRGIERANAFSWIKFSKEVLMLINKNEKK